MATAVYYRYHQRYETEFDSFDEALRFLISGEEYGNLSSEALRDGDYTTEGKELDDLILQGM